MRGAGSASIFLMSVLVLGLASYPSPLPNIDNDIHTLDGLQIQLGSVAFAQEEEEEEEEEKVELEESVEVEDEGIEEEAEEEEETEEEEEEEEIVEVEAGVPGLEVKAEIIGDQSEVKVERKFSTTTTDRTAIIGEIIEEFALNRDVADAALELETEEEEEEPEQKFEVEVEVEEGITEVEVELKFVLDTTEREDILDAIVQMTHLTTEQIEGVLEFETEEEEEEEEENEIEVEVKNGSARVKIELDGEKSRFRVDTTDESEIITAIIGETGLTESEIRAIWEFEVEEKEEEEEEENEIEVEVKNGSARVKIELDGEKSRFVLDTTDETAIIAEITDRTGLDESQIRDIWEFEYEGEEEELEEEEREAKLVEKMAKRESEAVQKAEETIASLQQRIAELEQRLESLLMKLETGEYFGTTLGGDPIIKSFGISFDGSATSLDGSTVTDVDGEIYIETLVTRDKSSKFRVTGGEILVGNTFYDVVFGKARASSSGPSGEKDSMVLIAQVMDDEGNSRTLKILLDSEVPLEGDFALEPVGLEIKMPQSKIAHQWFLSASGQLSILKV